jgi:hypothetical protein
MMFPPPGIVNHALRLADARRRLVALYAVQATFQRLQHDREWNRWISEARAGLQLSKTEHDSIIEASARLAPLLKQQVEEAGALAESAAPGNSNGPWMSQVNVSGAVAEVELRKTFQRGEILIKVHKRHSVGSTSTNAKSDPWARSGEGYSLLMTTRGSAQLNFDDLFDMYDSIAGPRKARHASAGNASVAGHSTANSRASTSPGSWNAITAGGRAAPQPQRERPSPVLRKGAVRSNQLRDAGTLRLKSNSRTAAVMRHET